MPAIFKKLCNTYSFALFTYPREKFVTKKLKVRLFLTQSDLNVILRSFRKDTL